MVDTLVHAELLAACSALGYSDGVQYHKEADCLETVKDLVRYLRRDDESHEIRRALGDTRVLQTDLVPIICSHSDDQELFDMTIRLLVNLTNPTLLLFREELPEEKVTRQQYLQMVSQQQQYKEAFVEEKVWSVLVGKLGDLLQLDWEHRQEEDKLLIERILILIRNVLSVPASPEEEKRTDDDASIHDQVLWALHLAGFEDLLLYLASSDNEQELCMHVLEIISLVLREQDPAQLAQAGVQRSESEKKKDEQVLLELRQREALEKKKQRQKYYGARHSRFGGTYYVQDMKSISNNDIVSHQPITDIKKMNFSRLKGPKKQPRNRLPMKESMGTRRSTLAIRLFLQEFCIEFLNGAYNTIMYIVKDNLDRARAQEHDESYYLWAIRFFMEFNRHHEFKIELVSETLSIQMFHFIQTHIENYYETMTTDKKKIPLWSRRLHKALKAYEELLMTLGRMDKSASEAVRESARVLKSKVFYVIEYREMLLILLQNYDPLKMTVTFLMDVVETTHIFLKMLEGFCGKNKHVMVQKAKKVPRKKSAPQKPVGTELTEEQLQDQWDSMSTELSSIIQGDTEDLPATIPFDALSEESEEEQKELAMRKINKLLRQKEMPEAVSLLRSSREVWPEGDVFGVQGISQTEEFLALREVFMANLNPPVVEAAEEGSEEDEEEEEEEQRMQFSEQEFSFGDFARRFANTKVIRAYCSLLGRYRTNSAHTNHCILKLFHRIAWDLKLTAIFFQASLFCVFQEAMEDPARNTNETVKEIVRFGKYIVRQFFKVAETNPKVFMELLFWKNNKEALEIEVGYDCGGTGQEAAKKAWKEEEEEELKRLYVELSASNTEMGNDVVDLILENLINQNRSRRAVIKKLKEMGLVADLKELKRKSINIQNPRAWSEEEEGELRMLFEEYKEAMDIVGRIKDNMVKQRSKNMIVKKILELGLVTDKKELWKKRSKKSKVDSRCLGERFVAANQPSNDEPVRDSESESSEDEDEDAAAEPISQMSGSSEAQSQPLPVATPALIAEALRKVLEVNMSEPVEWLARVVGEVANDREQDGDMEPVPLLAITDACNDAMEDTDFQNLMRLIGIRPPQDHQEMFWRVPSRLGVDALRKRAEYLTQGLSGNLNTMNNADVPLEPAKELQPVQELVRKASKNKKKETLSRKKTKKRDRGESFEDESLDIENKENENRDVADDGDQNSEKRAVGSDFSDDDQPLSLSANKNTSKLYNLKKKGVANSSLSESSEEKTRKKRRIWIEDDSEDEGAEGGGHVALYEIPGQGQGSNEGESGGSSVAAKRPLMVDSDSEEELPVVTSKHRVRAVVDSDDE